MLWSVDNTDKEFYLVNQSDKQFFVIVTDEFIELKHAWQFLLDNQVINAGFICKVPVSIGGTSWKQDTPIEHQMEEKNICI